MSQLRRSVGPRYPVPRMAKHDTSKVIHMYWIEVSLLTGCRRVPGTPTPSFQVERTGPVVTVTRAKPAAEEYNRATPLEKSLL